MVEGKLEYQDLQPSYQEVFDEILRPRGQKVPTLGLEDVWSCSSASCITARSTSSLATHLCRLSFLIACGRISLIRR